MAIVLDGDLTDLLEVITDGTEAIDVAVFFGDKTSTAYTPGKQLTLITTATTTTICSNPAASTMRVIERAHITNTSATSANVIVQLDVGGTDYEMGTFDIGQDESVVYDGQIWQVISLSPQPRFIAENNAAQTIGHNAFTKVTFGTEILDSNSNFETSRFTPTVAGTYQLSCCVCFGDALADGTGVFVDIYKNGSSHRLVSQVRVGANSTTGTGGSALVVANGSTDYFEVYVLHQHGSDRDLQNSGPRNWFTGVRVSP